MYLYIRSIIFTSALLLFIRSCSWYVNTCCIKCTFIYVAFICHAIYLYICVSNSSSMCIYMCCVIFRAAFSLLTRSGSRHKFIFVTLKWSCNASPKIYSRHRVVEKYHTCEFICSYVIMMKR